MQATSEIKAPLDPVVTNSIAIAVLKLRNYYFDDIDISDAYQECLRSLRALTAEDFFKSKTSIIPPSEEDEIHTDDDLEMNVFRRFLIDVKKPLNTEANETKLLEEVRRELFDTVGCIIAKSRDRKSDTVTLYLEGHEEAIELPLKLILPIVLQALREDAQFAKQYKGSAAQRLAQAQADRPLRMRALFDCLKQVKQGQCHIGIGNALMLLLNQTAYEGIHIIDDPRKQIETVIQHQLKTRVHDAVREIDPQSLKGERLKQAILTWMLRDNAHDLIDCLEAADEIHHEVKALFREHGSNFDSLIIERQSIPLSEFISTYIGHLPFQRDVRQQPVLAWIDTLLKENNAAAAQPIRNSALETMQTWLATSFDPWDKAKTSLVANFYIAYQTHKQLQYYMLILRSHGLSIDGMVRINQALEAYFRARPLGLLSTTLNEELQQIQNTIKKAKQDQLHDFVEGFFMRWSNAFKLHDVPALLKLYEGFIDKQAQIDVPDDFLTQWQGHYQDTNYERNSILLYAMITDPSAWSPLFANTFIETLAMIKRNSLEQTTENPKYSQWFIEQWDYLVAQRNHLPGQSDPVRPEHMLLLPTQVTTATEWFNVAFRLNDSKRAEIYRDYREFIDGLIIPFINSPSTLITSTLHLPTEEICGFIERLGEEKLASIVPTASDLFILLTRLTTEQGMLVCTMLKDKLPAFFPNLNEFFVILFLLDKQKGAAFCNVVKNTVPNLMQSKEDFEYALWQITFYQEHADNIFSYIKDLCVYFVQQPEYDLSPYLEESLPSEVTLFLREAKLFCEGISEIARHTSTRKAHDLMQALVENQPETIKARFDALFQSINENTLYALSPDIKREQQQNIIACIYKLPTYWLRRIESVTNSTQEEIKDSELFESKNNSAKK